MIKANPNIAAMASYALPDISAADGVEPIVLAQNEHVYAPSPAVQHAIATQVYRGNLYPDADWQSLRAAIANVHGLKHDNILCGSGSMELMMALALAYLGAGDRVLITEYGYLYMRTLVKMVGAELDVAAERDYRVDVDAIIDAIKPTTKLVFVVNPGNPSGTVIHNDEIRRLHAALPQGVLLLIDEAYAEFTDVGFHQPLFDLVEQGNTVITRTFSKVYGLAGMRVGWGYFPDAIGDNLRKVLNPNNVSLLSQVAAEAAMLDQPTMHAAVADIGAQRDYLSDELRAIGFSVPPSQTNFVLVDFADAMRAQSAFTWLRDHGLVVRPMLGYGLADCLRITIGEGAVMRHCVDLLKQWQEQYQ